MISLCDNTTTNHLIDYIGKEKIEEYVSKFNIRWYIFTTCTNDSHKNI
ncbi:hypothetical protein GM661_05200 [Iocasia frigidifontis]|uniref:Beta-lactamase class A catalytic domain-containing protein n=1 Tax=Iocasia fonsfrigidae TaxID=2682810 RepID=A0A8A7KDC5_9FIRM|nr:hypothetical protein GM661_05200 [Iocasia fonsfrigidae]